jgi:hypothetical protein
MPDGSLSSRLKPGSSSGRRDYRQLAGPGAMMGVESRQDVKKRRTGAVSCRLYLTGSAPHSSHASTQAFRGVWGDCVGEIHKSFRRRVLQGSEARELSLRARIEAMPERRTAMSCSCGGECVRAEFESCRGRVVTQICLFCMRLETELRSSRNNLLMWRNRTLDRPQAVAHLELVGQQHRIDHLQRHQLF